MEYPLCTIPDRIPRHFGGRALHGQRSAYAPFAAHPDPINSAQNQKYGVVRSKSAEQFHHGKENHICHERFAAAITVGQQSKDDRAHGPHGQGRGHRPHDCALGDVKLGRQRVHQKHQHEEIERVQGPAQKTGGDRMPLVGLE